MNFESLFSEWEKDAEIDKTRLDDESLKIPKLHHKYYRYLVAEKSRLKKLEAEYKKLRLEKTEFLVQGHDEETKAKSWKLPPRGIVLKADIPMYLEADQDIIDMSLQIGVQQEKVEFLESIIKTLNNRGYNIKTAVDFIRFTMGG